MHNKVIRQKCIKNKIGQHNKHICKVLKNKDLLKKDMVIHKTQKN